LERRKTYTKGVEMQPDAVKALESINDCDITSLKRDVTTKLGNPSRPEAQAYL